ncbi:MAG: hypothetical protein RLZZ571_160, partial [Actinomycetota bacterium]
MDGATPGQMVTGLVVVLGIALVVLLFSMNRHLKRVR